MSNAIYKKDLHDVALAVAQGSKDYTDKVRDSLRWEFGTYDLSAETINGTTMLLPTPANTIQATMVRIDGNSEVSENLIVLDDVAQTTLNGITYKCDKGIITISGIATATMVITFNFISNIELTADSYVLSTFNKLSTGFNSFIWLSEKNVPSSRLFLMQNTATVTTTFNATHTFDSIKVNLTNGETFNATLMPMLVKGSTVPTEFKVGYTGIHNLELTGLKVSKYARGTYLDSTNLTRVNTKLDLVNNATYSLPLTDVNYQYLVQTFNKGTQTFVTNVVEWTRGTASFTANTSAYDYVLLWRKVSGDNILPSEVPSITLTSTSGNIEISNTTLPIDLSTILYNGSPLFEGNSLKGVGTAKDYITPYVAHKGVGSRAYQSGDEEDTSVLTDGTTTLYPLTTPIEADIDFSQLVKFEAYSNGSTTLVNTNNQDTTSTFKYLKEVAK